MGISIWQILVVVVLLVLLFGRGKISELMGDVAKGIKSFRKGMREDPPDAPQVEAGAINAEAAPAAARESVEPKQG